MVCPPSRNRAIGRLLACALCLILASAPGLAQLRLTLAHSSEPANPRDVAARHFADLVRKTSAGRIEVEVAGGARLGGDAAALAALRDGTLDLSVNSAGPVSELVPEYNAFGLPFLFTGHAQAWKVLDGPLGRELADKSAAQGLVLLGYWDNGIRHLSNNRRPIRTPADLAGLRIRIPAEPVAADIIGALGASAHTIKFSELYLALQSGAVDGQENPLVNIDTARLYEVQKYLSLTGHKFSVAPFLIAKKRWDGLTRAERDLLAEAARAATRLQRRLALEQDERLLAELTSRGMRVDAVERAPFMAATGAVRDKWLNGPIGDYARRVLAAAQAR